VGDCGMPAFDLAVGIRRSKARASPGVAHKLVAALRRESVRRAALVSSSPSKWVAKITQELPQTCAKTPAQALLFACLAERSRVPPEHVLRVYATLRPALVPVNRLGALVLRVPVASLAGLTEGAGLAQVLVHMVAELRPEVAPEGPPESLPPLKRAPTRPDVRPALEQLVVPHCFRAPRSATMDFRMCRCPPKTVGKVEFWPFCADNNEVMNGSKMCKETFRPSCLIASGLVILAFRKFLSAQADSDSFEKEELEKKLSDNLSELQCCDLEGLNHEAKLCFWLNVFNAGVLVALRSGWSPVAGSGYGGTGGWFDIFSEAKLNVGGATFSLLEMEHLVLRAITTAPQIKGFGRPLPIRTATDKRATLGQAAPEVVFGIHCPVRSGLPPLRVFYPECVKSQLLFNAAHFFVASVHVNVAKRSATLPRILQWYAGDFGNVLEFVHTTLRAFLARLDHVTRIGVLADTCSVVSTADLAQRGGARNLVDQLELMCTVSGLVEVSVLTSVRLEYVEIDWALDWPRRNVCPDLGAEVAFAL